MRLIFRAAGEFGGGVRLQKNPSPHNIFVCFLRRGAVQPLILSGAPRTLVVENNDAF